METMKWPLSDGSLNPPFQPSEAALLSNATSSSRCTFTKTRSGRLHNLAEFGKESRHSAIWLEQWHKINKIEITNGVMDNGTTPCKTSFLLYVCELPFAWTIYYCIYCQ